MRIEQLHLPFRISCGVSVLCTSLTGAKPEARLSDSGDTTAFASFPSRHLVFIDIESLPTGIDIPSAGQNSMPTAWTASNSFWSSCASPAAAIQLADSLMSPIFSIEAPAMLVTTSPTAMRAEAAALMTASGVRSPIAIASPQTDSKERSVTAQSATGTCTMVQPSGPARQSPRCCDRQS